MKKWKTKNGYEIVRVLFGRCNVFLLSNGSKNILIDTSVSRMWPKLQKQLGKLGINSIDYLILTHAHFDHASNANRIKDKFNAKVAIQHHENRYLSKGDNTIPGGTNIFTSLIINLLSRFLARRFMYTPCKPDMIIDSGYSFVELGFNAHLLHTPGHTVGSMSLIIDDEIAIVGDTMFGVFGWSVFPPFAQDRKTLIQSWGKLLETNCTLFLPAHGTGNYRSLLQRDYLKRIKKYRMQLHEK